MKENLNLNEIRKELEKSSNLLNELRMVEERIINSINYLISSDVRIHNDDVKIKIVRKYTKNKRGPRGKSLDSSKKYEVIRMLEELRDVKGMSSSKISRTSGLSDWTIFQLIDNRYPNNITEKTYNKIKMLYERELGESLRMN